MNKRQYMSAYLARKQASSPGYEFETSSMRIIPLAYASVNSDISTPMDSQEDSSEDIDITMSSSEVVTLNLPATEMGGVFTYEVTSNEVGTTAWDVTAEYSTDSTDGSDGTWTTISVYVYMTDTTNRHLQAIELPVLSSSYWFKATITNNDTQDNVLTNVGIRHYSANYLDDIWVFYGASIMEGNIEHARINTMSREDYGQDPLIFNRGWSGLRIAETKTNISNSLPNIPKARFLFLHIGGNDVSAEKPYATSTAEELEDLEADLRDVVNQLISSNKTPIVARLTFRDYPNDPGVESGVYGGGFDEYGSKPYNDNIYDEVISDLTPHFYDTSNDVPMMDLFNATRNQQEYLSEDGVHYTAAGPRIWTDILSVLPMLTVYTGTTPTPYIPIDANTPMDDCDIAVTYAEGTQLQEDVDTAQASVDVLQDWILEYTPAEIQVMQDRVDAIVIVTPEVPVVYQIDFGPTDSSEAGWNVIDNALQPLTALVDSEENTSDLTLEITQTFPGTDEWGGYEIPPVPGVVMRDCFQLQAWNSAAVFEIGGLDAAKTYTLYLYSSQDNDASGYVTEFTVNSVVINITSSGNTSEVATYANLVPDANNKITVTVHTASGSNYGYMNAAILEEQV